MPLTEWSRKKARRDSNPGSMHLAKKSGWELNISQCPSGFEFHQVLSFFHFFIMISSLTEPQLCPWKSWCVDVLLNLHIIGELNTSQRFIEGKKLSRTWKILLTLSLMTSSSRMGSLVRPTRSKTEPTTSSISSLITVEELLKLENSLLVWNIILLLCLAGIHL